MTNRVIHVDELASFPEAEYVARANRWKKLKASPFANPYVIDKDGDRLTVIERYRFHLMRRLSQSPEFVEQLIALRGKTLMCWCRYSHQERAIDNACHADVLVALLDRHTDDELRAMATS